MKAVVFDCETTSLISSRMVQIDQLPEVIEFYGAMVSFRKTGKWQIDDELELLVKPAKMINEFKTGKNNITKITGITNEMLADSPSFAKVANKIFNMIEQAQLVIAHNLTYDREVLDIEAQRLGYQIQWPAALCTVEATAYLRGDRFKLSELHEHLFGEKFAGAHRAKQDVHALIRCCGALYKQGVIC